MGFFGSSNAFIDDVERATNENNSEENWDVIITICDKAGKSPEDAKNYLKVILKRLNNSDPHISIQAATLLDACVKNSGKVFHREVASRDFEIEYTKLVTKAAHISVSKKLRESLKRWAENEFKSDPQLNLIPSLYTKLKNSGIDFSTEMPVKKSAAVSKDPDVVDTQEEETDILKAIELSLKETSSPRAAASASSSLYPSTSLSDTKTPTPAKEAKKVRALYDFEAAEDNELTFRSGEIIFVIDDSDVNWWKGSNQRGEGLFPSNFVTSDLDVEPEKFLIEKAKKIVLFKDSIEVKPTEKEFEPAKVEINEAKIDRLLHLMHEVDPTNPETDTEEMLQLEREVTSMGPLIDSELEKVDRKHAQLTQLSADLVEAIGLYHTLMREQPPMAMKMPYNYGQMAQPPPPGAMPMPPFNGHPGPAMMPPPMGRQSMPPPHYATLPMMGGPPQGQHMPPMHMMGPPPPQGPMQQMPDDRRIMFAPSGTMISGNFPPSTMVHNGPPHQSQSQYNLPPQNVANNPK